MAKTAYNDLTAQELTAKSHELRQELFNLRLQKATARLERPHRIADLRKEIARCETRLSNLRRASAQVKATAPKA